MTMKETTRADALRSAFAEIVSAPPEARPAMVANLKSHADTARFHHGIISKNREDIARFKGPEALALHDAKTGEPATLAELEGEAKAVELTVAALAPYLVDDATAAAAAARQAGGVGYDRRTADELHQTLQEIHE